MIFDAGLGPGVFGKTELIIFEYIQYGGSKYAYYREKTKNYKRFWAGGR